MKKLMFAAVMIMGLSTMALAQTKEGNNRVKRTPEERAQMQTDKMEKKLSLSAEQKGRIYAINLERAKQMDENRAERRSAMKKNDASIEAVLNADQKKAYADWKAEKREKMKKHRKEGKEKGKE